MKIQVIGAQPIEIEPSPIEGSSVPGELDAAIHYAHRLEQRFKSDQGRIFAADRKLKIALAALCEELNETSGRMRLVEAIALIEAAREVLM